MSASNLSDLLPIPDGVAKPHAYQVFGLDGGERDNQKVSDAMRKTYAHLKAAKSSSDPATWKKAAKMAEEARKLLSDPEKRRDQLAENPAAIRPACEVCDRAENWHRRC